MRRFLTLTDDWQTVPTQPMNFAASADDLRRACNYTAHVFSTA
jgi:hypothetical protein